MRKLMRNREFILSGFMKIIHAVCKSHAGADEKHDINFHWHYLCCTQPVSRIEVRFVIFI